jgi:hypothetical protein
MLRSALVLSTVLAAATAADAAISYTRNFGQLMYQTGRVRSQLFETGSHDLAAEDLITPDAAAYTIELKEFEVMMIGNGTADKNYFGFYIFRHKSEVGGFGYPGSMVFAKLGAASVTRGSSAGAGYYYYRVKFQLAAGEFEMSPNTRYWVSPWRFGDTGKRWYTARRITGDWASGYTEGYHCRTTTDYPNTLYWGYPNLNDHLELAVAGKFWIHD